MAGFWVHRTELLALEKKKNPATGEGTNEKLAKLQLKVTETKCINHLFCQYFVISFESKKMFYLGKSAERRK